MTHPTQQQLLAWLDGSVDEGARAEETAAHVAVCARCQGVLDAATDLGAAMRVWAEDMAPAPVPDLADQIFRAAEIQAPAVASAPAAATPAATSAVKTAAPAVGGAPAATGARVVPLAPRRRWWLAATPVALAAAAAAVFVMTRPPRTDDPVNAGRGQAPVAARVDSGAPAVSPPGPTQRGNEPAPVVVAAVGSEVLAVDPDGKHTNVSVLELAGEQDGTTVAVVWIDDPDPAGRSTIQ